VKLNQIATLGKKLVKFLERFADCFKQAKATDLLQAYVSGQLSSIARKSIEPMALATGTAPRTLQRFVESLPWDEERLRDQCQTIVAQEHRHPQAIGLIDESGIPKSGGNTAGAARQWCGRTGKVDNCVVAVHTCYATDGFHCLLDSDLYLPEAWARDHIRRQKTHIPDDIVFRTKPQIAQAQIERALARGIRVAAWTFDEAYGRDPKLLDFLDQQEQTFVGEIPANFRGWVRTPVVLRQAPKNAPRRSRRKKYPRVARKTPACEVQDLVRYSPAFQRQKWQRFHIKESDKGSVVWEVKWARFYRQTGERLPSKPACLIVARNVLHPDEVKYFVANEVPQTSGEPAGETEPSQEKTVTLTWLLWVAFRRWPVEQCFRESKNELGMDHFEVRGWRCIHRHYYLTQLTHLFCARIRQEYAATIEVGQLTVEQVRRAVNTWLATADLSPAARQRRFEQEEKTLRYHQKRNEQAHKSHAKTRTEQLAIMGIHVRDLPCCIPSEKL
jgi:SRSO17 transposase